MCGYLPAVFILLALFTWYLPVEAERKGEISRIARNDTVMASLLVASPGRLIYQAGGHAAIRLQCPEYRLDNVFTYETNSEALVKQLLGQAKGRYNALVFDEYIATFSKEGREVREYPLNLTDPQIRTLWRILDEAVAEGGEDNFNIRWVNCNSRTMDKIVEALGTDEIVMNETYYTLMTNAELLRAILKQESPWSAMIFNIGCGADADGVDSWRTRMVPLIMGDYFRDGTIQSVDGTSRPILASESTVVSAGSGNGWTTIVTPTVLCVIMLILALAVSGADMAGRFPRVVYVFDCIFLSMQTIGSIGLILLAVIPASVGAAWNWMFLPFNILPVVVWITARKRAFCRRFYIVYGIICVLFIGAPLFTTEADLWSSLLSTAIAVRVLSHYVPHIYKSETIKNKHYES